MHAHIQWVIFRNIIILSLLRIYRVLHGLYA
nr:MAG TPA: hypothetical protein [Caudoviricetes sp.]